MMTLQEKNDVLRNAFLSMAVLVLCTLARRGKVYKSTITYMIDAAITNARISVQLTAMTPVDILRR